jgi:PadR family transcriptional regulator PadR
VTRFRRPSQQTIAVLLALAEAPAAWRYGYELGRQVGLKAGSMYPILMRLADRGLLETTWETEPSPGRPPRHMYRLTGSGLDLAAMYSELDPTTMVTVLTLPRERATVRLRPERA